VGFDMLQSHVLSRLRGLFEIGVINYGEFWLETVKFYRMTTLASVLCLLDTNEERKAA